MVKVTKLGNTRQKEYIKTTCSECDSELVFEFKDAWCEDLKNGIYRVECPICRMKAFFSVPWVTQPASAELASKEVYDSAIKDTSKSGLQMLMNEKRKEDSNEEALAKEVFANLR